jgi:multidrug efflux system membrane fusion protein
MDPENKRENARMKTELQTPSMIKDILDRPDKKNSSTWKIWAAAAAVAAGGIWAWRAHQAGAAAAHAKKGGGAVPVGVAAARRGDMPVYLDGLGNVTPFNTVTVHTRVDGQLMSVGFREGQDVQAGDLLAQIDPRPFQAALDQAEGQLARDQALLANAKLDLARYKELIAQDAIPKQQLDTQVATVGQDEGTVKNDQAMVDAAKVQLDYTRITSPITGRVGLRLVDAGNIVHAADPNGLVVVAQVHPMAVLFTLPEDNVPQVMRKLSAGGVLSVTAYNRDKSALLATGKLLTMDNQIDPTTGTSKLKAVFDNKDNALFPNQFVNVRLLIDTRRDQVIVPSAAVLRGSQGTYVYVIDKDGTAEVRPVTVGIVEGADTSIDKGVAEGENVVIDGADSVVPGGKVAVAGAPVAAKADGKAPSASASDAKAN